MAGAEAGTAAGAGGESRETRLRRLAMRARLRGMREMDLVLGPFAAENLGAMDGPALDAFEALLEEADADLLSWVLGRAPAPAAHAGLIAALAGAAQARARRT